MGRKKIDIKYIDDAKKRKITLSKRKSGLLKKAYELSVLCGCEMGIVIFDSEQKLYTYGSRGIDKTIKKWQGTKKAPITNWSNDDFDEEASGMDDDHEGESSEDEEAAVAKMPARRGSTGAAAAALLPPSLGSKGRKRTAGQALPSLMDSKPAKRHSNPRKAALERGVFSMPPSVFPKDGSGAQQRPTSNVQPILTPSLAASVGVGLGDTGLAQQLFDITTADITGEPSSKSKRVTRSNSGTPNTGKGSAGPFTAGFGGSGTDGLSPWLMSAVSSIEAPSSQSGASPMFPSSSGLGLTPPVAKAGTAAGSSVWPNSSSEGPRTRSK